MKNYIPLIFVLLFIGCGTHQPEQTYDEMLNDVVLNFNKGTTGGDSIINAFVKKYPTYDALLNDDSFMTVTVMKENVMLALIYDYLDAGQFDNVQHLYNNMLKYAEQEYGKVSQMTAMTHKEKAHLYERVGDLDNAIR